MRRVALARGAVSLRRTKGLARVPGGPKKAPVRRSAGTKTGDWSNETRGALQRRSGGTCEICGSQPGTDPHHRKPRRCRDHRVVNGLWLCRTCHDGAHQHPGEARDKYGWIVSSSPKADPASVPLLIHGNRWVTLEPNGTYRTHADSYPDVA